MQMGSWLVARAAPQSVMVKGTSELYICRVHNQAKAISLQILEK